MASAESAVEPTAQLEADEDEDVVNVYWLAGEGCDGCSIATLGATDPGVEDLLRGVVPQLPRVELHHPVLSTEWGDDYIQHLEAAANTPPLEAYTDQEELNHSLSDRISS